MKRKHIAILWYRNDLRTHDHEVLSSTNLVGVEQLLPIYCIDPRQFKPLHIGYPKTGAYRASFLLESLQALRKSLRTKGSNLYIAYGKPEKIIPQLAKQIGASTIYAMKEVADEEIRVEQKLEQSLDIPISYYWGATLFHRDDLNFSLGQLPDIFTQFRKRVEKYSRIRQPLVCPNILPPFPKDIGIGADISLETLGLSPFPISPKAAIQFKGGEQEALKRLEDYVWKRQLIATYKETRNGMLGESYSSKFSPWLANGSLSPRTIYHEVKTFEKQVKKNSSTYWLIFELIWRDYFRYVMLKYENRLFKRGGIYNKSISYQNSPSAFQSWITGETHSSFVNANMKELAQTGFMSNRGRQNVASYLCKDLGVDWRWGASYFESMLIDYDVYSNWGNWAYVAGVGNDPRPNRYFNVEKQAARYDPEGTYVQHWLDDLALHLGK